MFNMLLQLHHHRHKEQQLLSAKSISEITPPTPSPPAAAGKHHRLLLRLLRGFPPSAGKEGLSMKYPPPQNMARKINLIGVTTHRLSLRESELWMGCIS